jgi:hypothetical protein
MMIALPPLKILKKKKFKKVENKKENQKKHEKDCDCR